MSFSLYRQIAVATYYGCSCPEDTLLVYIRVTRVSLGEWHSGSALIIWRSMEKIEQNQAGTVSICKVLARVPDPDGEGVEMSIPGVQGNESSIDDISRKKLIS